MGELLMRAAHRFRLVLLFAILSLAGRAVADDWPQWRGPKRDGVWRESGVMQSFAEDKLPLKWEMPVGSGYSGPTVAAGRVYVTDRLTASKSTERVHCFDEQTGKALWSHAYDCPYEGVSYEAGPRACVTINEGLAYSLGTMGHLFAFDAATGKIVWQKDLRSEYKIEMPIWGIAAAPLIEGNLLVVHIGGTPAACLVAFDAKTGREVWRALSDKASYSSPIIVEQAGQRVLVCWTGDNVVGLEPSTGKVHWKYELKPRKMVIAISTPVVEKDRLFVTAFYDGSAMLRLDPTKLAVDELWRRRGRSENDTDALHSIIATPYFAGDYVYGVDSYGELRCLEAATGNRVWENQTATPRARWSNIHMVRSDERMWMFNERGELLIARLSPKGFEEIDRAKLIEPTTGQLEQRGGVCWAHPAFANRHVFIRNDQKIVCASLAAP